MLITRTFLNLLASKGSTAKEHGGLSREFNSLFRLTKRHILCRQSERQNVRLASELLSHTTSVNLKRHFGDYSEAAMLSTIIDIIDRWFNVMNSHNLNETIDIKKCLGLSAKLQWDSLQEMRELVLILRTLNKHRLPAANHLQVCVKVNLIFIIYF